MEGVPRTAGTSTRVRGLFDSAGQKHLCRLLRGRLRPSCSTRRCSNLPGRFRRLVLLALAALTVSLGLVGTANAQLRRRGAARRARMAPDHFRTAATPAIRLAASRTSRVRLRLHPRRHPGAEQRPDGGQGLRPVGARSRHVPGHDQRPRHAQQRKDFQTWQNIRKIALTEPHGLKSMLDRAGDDVKVPIFIQSAIHGNESEGVDAMFELVERLATTPYGADPEVDAILDHVVLLWNVDQNPDGRIAGPAGERQQLRPEPRLPDPVATRDPGRRSRSCRSGCRRTCSISMATSPRR